MISIDFGKVDRASHQRTKRKLLLTAQANRLYLEDRPNTEYCLMCMTEWTM